LVNIKDGDNDSQSNLETAEDKTVIDRCDTASSLLS